jgi:hypothetical protein
MDNNQTAPNEPKEIKWQAPEYPDYKKHPLWFVGFGLVIAALVLYGVLSGSWTTALTFILFGVAGLIFANKKPKTVTITINSTGIKIDETKYNYSVIKKFWILYELPELKALYFETSAYLNRVIKIELENQNPNVIREFLKKYLEEDLDQTESLADTISRKVNF